MSSRSWPTALESPERPRRVPWYSTPWQNDHMSAASPDPVTASRWWVDLFRPVEPVQLCAVEEEPTAPRAPVTA